MSEAWLSKEPEMAAIVAAVAELCAHELGLGLTTFWSICALEKSELSAFSLLSRHCETVRLQRLQYCKDCNNDIS